MQALHENIFVTDTIDQNRVKRLVDDAAAKYHGYTQLAKLMEVSPQLISNWRNGVKTPSPEAQADLAQIAGRDVLIAGLLALIDKSTGNRRKRLQSTYRDWQQKTSDNMRNL